MLFVYSFNDYKVNFEFENRVIGNLVGELESSKNLIALLNLYQKVRLYTVYENNDANITFICRLLHVIEDKRPNLFDPKQLREWLKSDQCLYSQKGKSTLYETIIKLSPIDSETFREKAPTFYQAASEEEEDQRDFSESDGGVFIDEEDSCETVVL